MNDEDPHQHCKSPREMIDILNNLPTNMAHSGATREFVVIGRFKEAVALNRVNSPESPSSPGKSILIERLQDCDTVKKRTQDTPSGDGSSINAERYIRPRLV